MGKVRAKAKKQSVHSMEKYLRTPSAQPDSAEALKILESNKDKNFVKRLLAPNAWPVIKAEDSQGRLGKGEHATHQMSWGEGPKGKSMVYPNIVHTPKGGMQWLKPQEAQDHAIKTKEYIAFDKPQDADWFSQRYKAGVTPNPPAWRNEKKAWKK